METTLGERIKIAREAKGLSQEAFVQALLGGGRAGTASAWENGHAVPEGRALLRMPEVLGVSGHWLLTGEGERYPVTREAAIAFVEEVRAAIRRYEKRSEGGA